MSQAFADPRTTHMPTPESAAPVSARQFAAGMIATMNTLLTVIEQETELVRAGRLVDAAELGVSKSELAGRYLADSVKLKQHARGWFGEDRDMLAELQRRHELFRALLQVNLTVLATAHAVAEGLIRGAADEAARKAAPQGYGARGHAMAPPVAARPVAVSRSL